MIDNSYVLTNLENVDPSPISPRNCKCDCALPFQPRRSDQDYINKKHADKDYHEKVRKPKQKNQVRDEKIQRRNDRILHRHFESSEEKEISRFLKTLTSEKFDPSYFVSSGVIEGKTCFFSYSYLFYIDNSGVEEIIKIRKQ